MRCSQDLKRSAEVLRQLFYIMTDGTRLSSCPEAISSACLPPPRQGPEAAQDVRKMCNSVV